KGAGFTDKVSRSVIQTGVSTGFNAVTQDLGSKEALFQMLANVGANIAGSMAAEGIGDLRVDKQINGLTQTGGHVVLGALVGAASNLKDPLKGAIGGGMGAGIAEGIAGNLPSSLSDERRLDLAVLGGGIGAFIAGGDVNAAGVAGTIAVENNWEKHKDVPSERPALDRENYDTREAGETKSKESFVEDYITLASPHWPPSESEFNYLTGRGEVVYNNIQLTRGPTTPQGQVAEVFTDFAVGGGGKTFAKGVTKAAQPVFNAVEKTLQRFIPQAEKTVINQVKKPTIPNTTGSNGHRPPFNPQAPKTAPPAAPSQQKVYRDSSRAPSPLPANMNAVPAIKSTKKPVREMNNQEFVQELANRTEKKVGGTGAVAGTKKHTYAKKLGERAQDRFGERGLEFEQGYKNGRHLKKGESSKGSTRLDVYDKTENVVYDYKFVKEPGKGLKPAQTSKIQKQGPIKVKRIIEVNPVKKGK
ncbi:MAG TPA: hypothetical protein VMW10_05650, partial [Alphaproteobacteria bacterium]|nr:hypothetical protein [Alphaproteobacteria bacterium]